MIDRETVIKCLEACTGDTDDCAGHTCPYWDFNGDISCRTQMELDALALLKEQDARIQKYEYVFDFLGIGFRQWTTKILDGEAEVICETDEHEHKTVVTFKLI